jgi:hypothetical protein
VYKWSINPFSNPKYRRLSHTLNRGIIKTLRSELLYSVSGASNSRIRTPNSGIRDEHGLRHIPKYTGHVVLVASSDSKSQIY